MRKSPAGAGTEQRSKREAERLFQIGDYWLGAEETGASIYYYWYDTGAGRVRRKPTGKTELEDAKKWLATLVLAEPVDRPLHPDSVTIAAVKNFYMMHHGDGIRSKAAAKRAFELLSIYMKLAELPGIPKVGDFTLARQQGFMRWCVLEYDLSGKSISTYLSYIKAGWKFSATPRLIVDGRGREREIALLDFPPSIDDSEATVSKVTKLPRSKPRDWIPTDGELARFIDCTNDEHVFRYVIVSLNTWARPEAICQLSVLKQVDFERRMVAMNPPGRMQNRKIRPTIRLTDNLFGWLKYWNVDFPICNSKGTPIKAIGNRTLKKAAKRAGIANWEKFTKYTLRHYMATRVRRVDGIGVSREERAEWIGHVDPHHRTTEAWYESLDPDHLLKVWRATDAVILMLSEMTTKKLVSPVQVPWGKLTLLKANDK